MSRKERRGSGRQAQGRAGADRIRALLEAGDHRAAGEEARRVLADPAAPEEERAAAASALASLAPEPAALWAGIAGACAAAVLAAIVVLRG